MGVLEASTSPPKEGYAVSNDNVVKLIQPGAFEDQLTEVLRQGAHLVAADARKRCSRILSPNTRRLRISVDALCATAIRLSARS